MAGSGDYGDSALNSFRIVAFTSSCGFRLCLANSIECTVTVIHGIVSCFRQPHTMRLWLMVSQAWWKRAFGSSG